MGKDYLGVGEVAAVLGITKQAVCNRAARGTLPKPVARLALGPIWNRDEIMVRRDAELLLIEAREKLKRAQNEVKRLRRIAREGE